MASTVEAVIRALRKPRTLRGVGITMAVGTWLTYVSYQKHGENVFFSEGVNRAFAAQGLPLEADSSYPFPRTSSTTSIAGDSSYQVMFKRRTPQGQSFLLKTKLPWELAESFPGAVKPREIELFVNSSDPSFNVDAVKFDEILSTIRTSAHAPIRIASVPKESRGR